MKKLIMLIAAGFCVWSLWFNLWRLPEPSPTTGRGEIVVDYSKITSGVDNIVLSEHPIIGYQSAASIESGYSNIAIGCGDGKVPIFNKKNVGVDCVEVVHTEHVTYGAEPSIELLAAEPENIAVGHYARADDKSTFIGHTAIEVDEGVFIGYKAGEFVTSERMNTLIGAKTKTNGHSYCVIIGTEIGCDYDYQVKVGNSEIAAYRQMTPEEFLELQGAIRELIEFEQK